MSAKQSPSVYARSFWKDTGMECAFPRPIEQALSLRLKLSVIKLPKLTTAKVCAWLGDKGLSSSLASAEQEIVGCLFAYRGAGIIFISSTESAEEQRYTIGHEVGHFIADYLEPRTLLVDRLGSSITAVLDGERKPMVAEQLDAVLCGLKLGPHFHVVPHTAQSSGRESQIRCVEDRADALALELLAPRKTLERLVTTLSEQESGPVTEIADQAALFFGIPSYVLQDAVARCLKPRTLTLVESLASEILRRQT